MRERATLGNEGVLLDVSSGIRDINIRMRERERDAKRETLMWKFF